MFTNQKIWFFWVSFAEILPDDEVVSLEGDLGSGKTTFVKNWVKL